MRRTMSTTSCAGSVMEKLPLSRVTVPIVGLPLTPICAPTSASPVSASLTLPETTRVGACALVVVANAASRIAKTNHLIRDMPNLRRGGREEREEVLPWREAQRYKPAND